MIELKNVLGIDQWWSHVAREGILCDPLRIF